MPQSSLDMTNELPNDPLGNQRSHHRSEVAISQQPLHSVRLLLSSWMYRGTVVSRWAVLWKSSVKLWKCDCIIIPSTKRGEKVRKANKKKQQLLVWERTFVPSGLRASLLRLPRAVSGWRRKAFPGGAHRTCDCEIPARHFSILELHSQAPCHRPARTQYSQGKETAIFWKHPARCRIQAVNADPW